MNGGMIGRKRLKATYETTTHVRSDFLQINGIKCG